MKFFISILIILFSNQVIGQRISKIDSLIQKEKELKKIPALAVAIIDSGKLVHISVNGFKDLEKSLKADINSSFYMASVSKVVLSMAVFKLVEQKKLNLEEDINEYLPFGVRNPHFPNDKITISRLLKHRSGLRDNLKVYGPYWGIPRGDSKIELSDFLKNYLTPGGTFYSTSHYANDETLNSFKYTNTGYALLGLIIEELTDMSLESFCQENIFVPQGMNNTSWFLKNLRKENIVKTYFNSSSTGFIFKGHNGYPDYPAGQLRTSISDFAKLILGYVNKSKKTPFFLDPKTIDLITPFPGNPNDGHYTWFMNAFSNKIYYWHAGGDVGTSTITAIDLQNKDAVIIFANSEALIIDLMDTIIKIMTD